MTVRVRIEPGGRQAVRFLAGLLMVVGLGGILYWMWALAEGAVYQYVQSIQFVKEVGAGANPGIPLEKTSGNPLVPGIAPPPARTHIPLLGTLWKRDPLVIGRLEVPRIGLSVMIRDGVDEATLRKAAGHLPSSAAPGQPGNFVVLGHRDTFFRPLRDIARGDLVRVETRQGDFTYLVESVTARSPDAVPVAGGGPAAISTLITCFPFSYTGPAPRRFVVQARLAEAGETLDPAVH